MRHLSLFGALTAAAMTILAGSANADHIKVRYGIWAKEGEAQHIGALKFKEVLETESGGHFEVTIFPGNQLGTPREMLAQLALGDTQIMATGDPGLKEIEYLALPYLMKGIANYGAVMSSEIGAAWNTKLLAQRRVRFLGFLPRSPRQISTDKPVYSVADLAGLKLRSPERDYYVESLTALGAKPTPMAFKEVYGALQTGIVDGQENPIETIYAQKFYEVQGAIAMVDYIDKPAYVMVSEQFWRGLSEEHQDLLRRAHKASKDLIEKILPSQQKDYLARMEASGITITYPDKGEFIEATQSVRDELGTEVWGEETYRKIVEIGQQDLS